MSNQMNVITYSAPNGSTIDLTPHQIASFKVGEWPRNASGEYCTVSQGLHLVSVDVSVDTSPASPAEIYQKSASVIAQGIVRHRGTPSKFRAHIDTIRSLRRRKCSYAQIHRFLNENGIKCSYIGLVTFCRMNFK